LDNSEITPPYLAFQEKADAIPDLTHLQALVIQLLVDADRRGRDLRDDLRREGVKMSGPAFYELMARIEERKLVAGRYVVKVVDGHTIKERWYHMEKRGLKALARCATFMPGHDAFSGRALI